MKELYHRIINTVHVTIISRMGTRCFWDAGTDNQASETFMNVSLCTNNDHRFSEYCIAN